MNIVFGLVVLAQLSSAAWGANAFQVTNINDAGLGSLRQAILNANSMGGNPTITFNTAPGSPFANAAPVTIALTSGELGITVPLTIQGLGAKIFTVSGSHAFRVFNVNPGAGNSVNIVGVTIRDGAPQAASANGGGGVLIGSGTLNLTDSEVTNNDSSQSAIPLGGGIDNEGAAVNLVRCAIVNNTAPLSGGGIQNQSGGTMTLVNCTIAGNAAGVNGNGGGICSLAALTLINCTLFGNSANTGGNTFDGGGTINFQNTIIAGGVLLGNGGSGPDISGAGYNSLDYNLIQNASGGTITGAAAHNVTGVSPMLGALADNGGPTRTLALRMGSPALDAGSAVTDPTTSAPLATDQRGNLRPVNNPYIADPNGGDGSDIGAFELQPAAPTLSITSGAYAFENSSSGAIPFTIDDADTPIANLTVSATSGNPTLLPNSGIQLSGSGAIRTVTFTPASGQTGDAGVTFMVSDGTFVGYGFLALTVTTPAAITSDPATVLTIGQQCPEVVVIANDQTVEVGTPCPFTVTTSGSPIPTITLGGQALPSGVSFTDNFDGTGTLGGIPDDGTAGNYALTFTATNSLGSSLTQNFTLRINTPPAITSFPVATPSPAAVGQAISFSAAAVDADGDTLSYIWNFGEGTNGTAPTVTHVYNSPGTYLVYLIVTDPSSAFVYDQVFVTVGGNGVGGGNENEAVVGAGPDSDGDGFSDAFENAVGTDPNSAASTPSGQPITAAALQPLTVSTASIKLNFASANRDSIAFTGRVPVPQGFNPNGATVYVDVGGVAKALPLNAKSGGDSVKIALKSKQGVVQAQTARYTIALSQGSFAATLAGAGLTNTSAKKVPLMVKFTFLFNTTVYQSTRALSYTARFGKSGSAK